MKNKLSDLNDHLYAQLELMRDEDLSGTRIEQESLRSMAIVKLSGQILNVANTQLRIVKEIVEHGPVIEGILPQIKGPKS